MDRQEKIRLILATGKRISGHMHRAAMTEDGEPAGLCSSLSAIQVQVVMKICEREALSLSELARLLDVSSPAASTMVDRLVEKKVLQRETDPEDRRRIVICIHPEAEEDMRRMQERYTNRFTNLADRVGDETVERWHQVMLRVKEVLDEEER